MISMTKAVEIKKFIENDGTMLAICGGFNSSVNIILEASGRKIDGRPAMDHYTLNQENNRFIGDIEIHR